MAGEDYGPIPIPTPKSWVISQIESRFDSGATFPAAPTVRQLFLHTPPGRQFLYQYDGATWQPLMAYGTMDLYVDAAAGTDDLSHGFGTGADAWAHFQYAIDHIPNDVVDGDVKIHINGNLTENVTISKRYSLDKNKQFIIYGQDMASTAKVATGGSKGAWGAAAYVTGAFVANQYDKKIIHFTSGANNGTYAVISLTTATKIYLLSGVLPADPANLDTYEILDWNTTITGKLKIYGNPMRSSYGSMLFLYCKFTTNTNDGTGTIAVVQGMAQFQYCYIINNGVKSGVMCTAQSYVNLTTSVVEITNAGAWIGVWCEWNSQTDLNYVLIIGNDNTQEEGALADINSSIGVNACEIRTGLKFGLESWHNSMIQIMWNNQTTWIHGCATYGDDALTHSFISGLNGGVWGVWMDATADANGANSHADAVTFAANIATQ